MTKRVSLLIGSALVVLLMTVGLLTTPAGAEESEVNDDVELTEEQRAEMEALHHNAFDQHKVIIEKYVEYGVFTDEKGEKMKSYLDERFEKLKENDFIPKMDHNHHKKKKDDNNS
ncbi:YckD family protein [Alkalibacillus haloalkaliphilus]|uniref:YckD family protein n=1 Tax=Alkalibacillus haloalkaliphilus TaxID=94136 RepID=UPI002935B355|nr:YckD family protein [Alkalibacillus haloalkaliphilus]MDV2581815.1 YckD family protein [Alkalibacillus haloalkaliphilus]